MTPRQKLVVIGNGMAGVACVEKILERDPGRFEITIFGAEPRPNYDRIQLSSVLAGKSDWRDIVLNSEEWYESNNVRLHLGCEVTAIDRQRKIVCARGGLAVVARRDEHPAHCVRALLRNLAQLKTRLRLVEIDLADDEGKLDVAKRFLRFFDSASDVYVKALLREAEL